MSEELKPCPFCGNEPAPYWKGVGCVTSGCLLNGLHLDADKWNRRAQPAEAEGVDLQRLSAEFEAWWDRQPHREQFEDLKLQFRNVAVAFYQKGREDVVIELPHRESMMACPNTSEEFDSGYGVAVKHCRAAIEAAGVTVRG